MTLLTASVRHTVGAFAIDATVEAQPGVVTGLLGASGSGKTTVLRCIAGLTRPLDGSVRLGNEIWSDGSSFVPTHARGIGYVTQHDDLFPHLSVQENLEYAFSRAAWSSRAPFSETVERLGVSELLPRPIGNLSGGERQRVAVARALLSQPRVMLLDEPVSALDPAARRQVLRFLDTALADLSIPVVYVSHSLNEVARLCEQMVRLDGGRVVQSGAVGDVMATRALAQWSGEEPATILRGETTATDEAYGLCTVVTGIGPLVVQGNRAVGTAVKLQINARDVSIGLDPQQRSSILNELPLIVREMTPLSDAVCLVTMGSGEEGPGRLLAHITNRSLHQLELAVGMTVYARVKGVAVLD